MKHYQIILTVTVDRGEWKGLKARLLALFARHLNYFRIEEIN